jgi:hypothetical protein
MAARDFKTAFGMILLALAFTPACAAPEKPKPHDEPPLEFTLTVDGKPVDVRADEPTRVKIGDRDVDIRLTPKPERLLKVPGLRFRYPAGHSYEVEPGESTTRWTLDGNDNVIILTRLAAKADPAQVARESVQTMVKGFGRGKVKTAPSELRLGGRTYSATRLNVSIASQPLIYEICAFNAGGATFILAVQDSPAVDGSPSAETRRVLDLLDKTLALDE